MQLQRRFAHLLYDLFRRLDIVCHIYIRQIVECEIMLSVDLEMIAYLSKIERVLLLLFVVIGAEENLGF